MDGLVDKLHQLEGSIIFLFSITIKRALSVPLTLTAYFLIKKTIVGRLNL